MAMIPCCHLDSGYDGCQRCTIDKLRLRIAELETLARAAVNYYESDDLTADDRIYDLWQAVEALDRKALGLE